MSGMTANERWFATIICTVLLGMLSWLLSTVSQDGGRIAILESQVDTIKGDMARVYGELREHRNYTEKHETR